MTPQARRRIIPLIVFLAAASVILVMILSPKRSSEGLATTENTQKVAQENIEDKRPENTAVSIVAKQNEEPVPIKASSVSNAGTSFDGLHIENQVVLEEPISLGSLNDINTWKTKIYFSQAGAGIRSIQFSDIFETVDGKLAWNKYRKDGGEQPSLNDLYRLVDERVVGSQVKPVLGAFQIDINNQKVALDAANNWKLIKTTEKSVSFDATVVDSKKNIVAIIHRTWTLSQEYGLHLAQTVENKTDKEIDIRWLQYGPSTLTVDRSRYMDRRRFRFGWELSDEYDPNHAAPIQSNDFYLEFTDVTGEKDTTIWPTEETKEEGYKLSWFASTNRYFALAICPNINAKGEGPRTFTDTVEEITSTVAGAEDNQFVLTGLWSPKTAVPAKSTHDLSMNVYAGPLKRSILDNEQPYVALNMRDLVLYEMSSMCSFCTFQWLADFLATVLTTLDQYVVFDWGFAIILLVLIVRGILHPLTKRSQINMQRFGKVMQKLKPEIDKLKQKYPNEPKRVQTEQMALMQKYGVNPFQMLGCLPMFLQMPIWIALYALLYFMFDIRQEPAFFGVFQLFGDWPFLADLSSADHFFGKFSEPKYFLFWNITGINLLPILMGAIFFVQQKYMSPQSMATTPEQQSQQKIMRVMMVVMFPLMLYSAPSGLTLYILTSSSVGILESRRIRKHIDAMPLEPTPKQTNSPRKMKDKQGRAWSDAMEARRKKVQNKAKKKSFKKRD